jgi:hypothetical protein
MKIRQTTPTHEVIACAIMAYQQAGKPISKQPPEPEIVRRMVGRWELSGIEDPFENIRA